MDLIQIDYPGEVIAVPESKYPIPKKKKKEEVQKPLSSSSSSRPQSSSKIKSTKGTIKSSTKSKSINKKKKNKRYVDVNEGIKQKNSVHNEDSIDSIQVVVMVDSNQDLDSNIVIDNPSEDSAYVADEINPDSVESTGGVSVDLDVIEERIDDNDVEEDSLDYDEYVRQHAAENEEEDVDDNNGDDDGDATQDALDSADGNNEAIVKNRDDDNDDINGDGDNGINISSMDQAVVDVDEQVLDTNEVEVKTDSDEAAVQLAKTMLSIMELDTISTYCQSGDSLVTLCKTCLQLDDPVLYTQVTNHEHRLFYNSSSSSSSAAAVFDSENGDNKSGIHIRTLGKSDHHPLTHPIVVADSGNSSTNIEQQLLVLVTNGIASFLADLLIKPRRAIIKHHLSWLTWTRVIELICQSLKHDFDTLIKWR
jgi:hypothetical protein